MAWASASAPAPDTVTRDVLVDLRRGHLSVERRAVVDRCSPLLLTARRTLQFNVDRDAVDAVRQAAFGTFTIGDANVRFGFPRLELDGNRAAIVDAGTVEFPAGSSYVNILQIASSSSAETTRMHLMVDPGTALWSGDVPPFRETNGDAQWSLPGGSFLVIGVRPLPAGEAVPAPESTASSARTVPSEPADIEAGKARARRASSWLAAVLDGDISVATPAWLGITYAVPFMLMLGWGRNRLHGADAAPRWARPLVRGARAGLLLLLVLVIVETFERLGQAGLFAASTSWLGGTWQFDPVYAVLLVACWSPPSGEPAGPTRRGWPWTLSALVFLVLALAWAGWLASSTPEPFVVPDFPGISAAAWLTMKVSWLFSDWPGRSRTTSRATSRRPPSWGFSSWHTDAARWPSFAKPLAGVPGARCWCSPPRWSSRCSTSA